MNTSFFTLFNVKMGCFAAELPVFKSQFHKRLRSLYFWIFSLIRIVSFAKL